MNSDELRAAYDKSAKTHQENLDRIEEMRQERELEESGARVYKSPGEWFLDLVEEGKSVMDVNITLGNEIDRTLMESNKHNDKH